MIGHVIERRSFDFDEIRNELNATKATANKLHKQLQAMIDIQGKTTSSNDDQAFISYLSKITQPTPQLLASIGYSGIKRFLGSNSNQLMLRYGSKLGSSIKTSLSRAA